ncbi:GNAT family protein [Saccharomonospora sp.]|uniref:GNAT family N-acetyltransferase n=1 Tax=Saccharomonospora sp. TaxID=33913 RepID=UPI002601F25E|nr:GNAT family protein [Saccharomonospora sp.]
MKGKLVSLDPSMTAEDWDLLAQWSSSEVSVFSSGGVYAVTGEQLRTQTSGRMTYMMVIDKDGERVGAVNWHQLTYDGHFEVGSAVGIPELWDLGYGVEAVMLLIEFLFHQRNAHRIHLKTGAFNRRMVQIFTSGHIRIEGVLRDYFFLDGEYHDAIIGSILRHEYYHYAELDGDQASMDLIPAEDKVEAKRRLREYLTENPIRF